MSIQESINQQLTTFPENLQVEILDFIMFLKYKQQKSNYNSDKLLTEEQRRQKIGDCLIKLAKRNPFFEIKDAVAWQREIRTDRPLPGREE
ncbi:MAG: DUF2281 domain-containing protein [Candidatus Methylumidiphilus sp.]